MEEYRKIALGRRTYNHLELKVGDRVILDADFNNGGLVTIVDIGPIGLFATITDGNNKWDVMTYRLTRPVTKRGNS